MGAMDEIYKRTRRKGWVRDGREKARFDYQAAVVGRV